VSKQGGKKDVLILVMTNNLFYVVNQTSEISILK